MTAQNETSVTYSLLSPDSDQGYPGNLSATATYTVTPNNELIIEYHASTDKPTPVNMTNHTYFNLAGKVCVLLHEKQERVTYLS